MPQYQFSVNLRADLFERYYRGEVNKLQVTDIYGRTLWINCKYFTPFVDHNGVYGQFLLTLSDNGQFESMRRLG